MRGTMFVGWGCYVREELGDKKDKDLYLFQHGLYGLGNVSASSLWVICFT